MAWKKGQSGNPAGGPKEKVFADALRLVINEEDPQTGFRRLRKVAEKLVECAENGESWAIQQVADRLDGKPAQSIDATVNDQRDVSELSSSELLARTAAVLRRVEGSPAGDRGTRAGKKGTADVREFH